MAAKGAEYWKKVVKEQIQKSHVLIYSKTTCPFCKRVNVHTYKNYSPYLTYIMYLGNVCSYHANYFKLGMPAIIQN